ncbi:MAG: ferritin family protein [bacterium]
MSGNQVTENTHIQDALKMALEREKRAYDFYREGMEKVKDAGVRELFKEMAVEERCHMSRIQAEIDREILREN